MAHKCPSGVAPADRHTREQHLADHSVSHGVRRRGCPATWQCRARARLDTYLASKHFWGFAVFARCWQSQAHLATGKPKRSEVACLIIFAVEPALSTLKTVNVFPPASRTLGPLWAFKLLLYSMARTLHRGAFLGRLALVVEEKKMPAACNIRSTVWRLLIGLGACRDLLHQLGLSSLWCASRRAAGLRFTSLSRCSTCRLKQ